MNQDNSAGGSGEKLLLCFAQGRADDWEAICLDFDIAVQGRSFEEVEHLLEISIADYVESAAREPPEIGAKLLRRSAPWRVQAGYLLKFFWRGLRGRGRGKDGDLIEHSFQMPCPA